ncbi:MAG: lysophospholipid acyltransferase family protein [Spirochaetaceae bacterium]|nr:lysophospholipid acyltransferase family protein [Spirochaetaceae bacterium]
MDQISAGDSYETPDGIPPRATEYLFLGSRWSPYFSFFSVVLRSRALAVAGLYDDEAWFQSALDIVRGLESCRARFFIDGLDNIRKLKGPAVFVSNHMSTLETVILPALICPIQPTTFVVKRSLITGKIWGPIMRSRDPIVVGRVDPKADLEAVLGDGTRILGAGRSVVVFPQGTRTAIFDPVKLNSIGVKLAARAGVPVIPVAVKTDYWGNSKILRGFGPVRRDRPIRVSFGPIVPVQGAGKSAQAQVLNYIEGKLREWGAPIAPRAASGVARAVPEAVRAAGPQTGAPS